MTSLLRLAFSLLFCLFFHALIGQVYTPIVINGEAFFSTELETSNGPLSAEVTVANFEKINGQLYNRVFFKRGFGADELIGYLREDPGTSQVFFRTTDNEQEFLVFDLELEVGDEITLQARWCDGQAGDLATVVAVNDVDGLKEIVFDREVGDNDICEQLRFLESVGPSATLIFPIFRDAIAENGTAQRICHASHNAVIYYPANSDVDFCGGNITSSEEAEQAAMRIFPNPAADQIFFADFPPNAMVQVFNNQGQSLGVFTTNEALNCSNWPSGVYAIRLLHTSQQKGFRLIKY